MIRDSGLLTAQDAVEKISGIVLTEGSGRRWLWGAVSGFCLLLLLNYAVLVLFFRGVGIWGIDIPVAWGFAIVNFVWWVGIAHAGTLISAILLLCKQDWRTSINRFAEALTLFSLACAGLFPLLHLGRPWLFYWLFPYPNTMGTWPQFRSPLVWDVFAVSTYAIISLLFWYLGLIPDLAVMRERARSYPVKVIYAVLSLGWRGSARHWIRHQRAYLILAALATPLVVSVHSVVSLDFSVAIVPGWHSTIFPPYFVAGAILSGFAMVLTIVIPLRRAYGLEAYITQSHLDKMGKLVLTTSLLVSFGYLMENFMAYYSGNIYDRYESLNRLFGPYRKIYWGTLLCNSCLPLLLWSRQLRSNNIFLFFIALAVDLGMWMERYVIVVVSLHRDFLPSSWGMYRGTLWDWATFIGSIGLFATLLFLFIRLLPMISISEMREKISEAGKEHSA
jgi:molybdopterin-containing oxidoreductase family membrane subunit